MKALGEIGWGRAARFGFFTLAMVPYRLALFPQLRAPWLRLLGARIGRRTILHDVRFFNLYRRGLAGLEIGDGTSVGAFSVIGAGAGVRIGSNVMLGQRVNINSEMHRFEDPAVPIREQGAIREGIVVEDDCWIGSGAIVLDGVTVGRGSVVGAGSVVTRDLPPFSIAAGVPARVIGQRGDGPPMRTAT